MVVTTEIVLLFCIMIFLGIVISFISTFVVLNKLTSLKTDINEVIIRNQIANQFKRIH